MVGQSSPHEAVARTSAVSGGLTVRRGISGLEATGLRFTAQLANLQSADQVAGYDVTQRDRYPYWRSPSSSRWRWVSAGSS